MQISISEDLIQYVGEIKRKQIISIKEFLKLQTIVSKDRNWIVYFIDFFGNILLCCGIYLIIDFITVKFEIELNFFIKIIITETMFGTYQLFWRIFSLHDLFKVLKTKGIRIAEIENLKRLKFNQGFQANEFLKVTKLLYSGKTQKDTFEPIVADWQEEYFEALFKKEIWKARWINVRYTYAFIVAMWQKSPIGDLIEFVRKIAS